VVLQKNNHGLEAHATDFGEVDAMSKLHDAMLWSSAEGRTVRCRLCSHQCVVPEGKIGVCGVRENVGGKLKTHTYDKIVALHVDPIEKKPLFHVLPGTASLSIAAPGCNFRCAFCQNWRISQSPREGRMTSQPAETLSPKQVVAAAVRNRCASISYTYTEPTIFFELAYDTAVLARGQGLKNIFVSNGYLSAEAVRTLAPVLDAINVDLKAFSEETYRRVMGARLGPVLECLEALVAAGVWVEVTTLVVPGMNDSPRELGRIAMFIAETLGPAVPWHVSRYHGDYQRTDDPPTPLETMKGACEIGRRAGLKYVYSGNLWAQAGEKTFCPACGLLLVDRQGYTVREIRLQKGQCPGCGEGIDGVWA
jgi:pyruvate formate lyase activating enzyme